MSPAPSVPTSAQPPRHNIGHAVLNDAPCGPVATIAATGLGRSGTTMLARILEAMGIPMGAGQNPQFGEDPQILAALKARDFDGFAALCRARDAAHPKWGFKCPALRGRLKMANRTLRHPRYVVAFRDILAISLRNKAETGQDLNTLLVSAAQDYDKMIGAVLALRQPVFLLSYEKALQYPEQSVQALAGFCGKPLDADRIAAIARATVRNADPRYLYPEGGGA